MKKGLLAGLVCALIIGILLMLKTGREPDVGMQATGNSFLEDVRIVQKKNGVTAWTLTAEKADILEKGDKALLRNVSLAVPANRLTLFAESGTYDFAAKSFAADAVVEARGENYRVTADSLDLDLSSAVIQTEGRVRLEGNGFSLEGEGMQAGQAEKVRILKDVKATFHR